MPCVTTRASRVRYDSTMTTITQRFTVNVQRLILEGDFDHKSDTRKRGHAVAPKPLVKPAPVVAAPAPVSVKANTTTLPASYAGEPIALPSTPALAKPTPPATERTFPAAANPLDFDSTMSLADAMAYVLAKTDAAGMPRDVAAARLQYEVDVARAANSRENADGSVTVPTDAEIVATMGNWAAAFIGAYQQQMNPVAQVKLDGTANVVKSTHINPEDRVDTPRNAPYPGPYNPKVSLEEAIQYAFQFYDAQIIGTPHGDGHLPRSYTAAWIDNFIKQQVAAGVPESAIVANLGTSLGMIASGYNFEAWREYYAANPEAAAEHQRMLSQNSAQTQVLVAQL